MNVLGSRYINKTSVIEILFNKWFNVRIFVFKLIHVRFYHGISYRSNHIT